MQQLPQVTQKGVDCWWEEVWGVFKMHYQQETVALISRPSNDPASVWLLF